MIRKLGYADYDAVLALQETVWKRARASGSASSGSETHHQQFHRLMEDHYLSGRDTHALFGLHHDGELVGTVGARMDMPIPATWSFTNLKLTPALSAVSLTSVIGLGDLLRHMYLHVESRGFHTYYVAFKESRLTPYGRVYSRLFGDVYNRYSSEVYLRIEPGERPADDLWFGMMGRSIYQFPLIIKKGSLKTLRDSV
jgi:hypothetical protein